jgi:16S rRNA (guanine(1405)-N(7))-methyltransferase
MKEIRLDPAKMTAKILDSPKYRALGVSPDTLQDLIQQELPKHASEKAMLKAVKRKLHNIVAPYLGEPDYDALTERLSALKDSAPDSADTRAFCRNVLAQHASTAERLPYLDTFYHTLFQTTGTPKTLLDLACGLNPLSFPWMNLPISTAYYAYDIIQPRVDFINAFFSRNGLQPLAENRDILASPPTQHADLALFFKEAHRFEKRQPGCNQRFWASLDVDLLAVSLPAHDLSGTHSLIDQHRNLVYENLPPNHGVTELLIQDEILFLIEKPGGQHHG